MQKGYSFNLTQSEMLWMLIDECVRYLKNIDELFDFFLSQENQVFKANLS